MNDIELFANAMSRAMTIQQIAMALGVPERTVHNAVDRILPGIKRNGIVTMLDEKQVAEVSRELKKAHNSELASSGKVIETDLEIAEMTLKVIAYHKGIADRLRAELADAQPKIESHEALMRSELTMSITDAAKHFGLHPKTEVFPYLRAHNYLTRDDLPSQTAIDAGYLALRQNPDRFGVCHPQAVVLTWQLENWRAHIVHQVKRWMRGIG